MYHTDTISTRPNYYQDILISFPLPLQPQLSTTTIHASRCSHGLFTLRQLIVEAGTSWIRDSIKDKTILMSQVRFISTDQHEFAGKRKMPCRNPSIIIPGVLNT